MNEREIYIAAAQIESPEERAAFLDKACGNDAGLLARLNSLLAEQDQLGSFMEAPAEAAATVDHSLTEKIGLMIGPYKLLQKLGEGGMGLVWVAEQERPVKRRVALKVIKPGMDSTQVIARFEAERQALAMMDHCNIAKVLDAGTVGETKDEGGRMKDEGRSDGFAVSSFSPHPSSFSHGRPYFVMELVKGVPITKYCDELNLPIRERLALFVPVCQAIQHAHQKGIIHRDLKPSNVLVAMQDGRPIPKVIDFGVAKALHQPLTERTLMTEFGAIIGTLEYMSPEQAELSALDIDTRADIYALGVLLYELLTGSTPLDRQRLRTAALNEMLRIIREDEPPRPSTRLTSSENLASLAAHRRTEPRKLGAQVRGELDWIVMKALEKDRTRRYETASSFARDIENFLTDAPVAACPPSAAYRLSKFLRRHRGPVLAAALVLLTLVVGIIGTTWGLIRAEHSRHLADAARASETARAEAEARERRRAEAEEATALANEMQAATERDRAQQEQQIAQAVKDFLQHGLLHQADAYYQGDAILRSGGTSADIQENPTIRELLDRAASEMAPPKIEQRFPSLPLVQAEILRTIGDTYRMLGEYGPATALLERSRDLYVTHRGPDHPETLTTLSTLAFVYTATGKFSAGAKLYEQVRDKQIAALGPDHPDTLTTMHDLAWTYRDDHKFPESIQLFEHVRDRRIATLGADHPDTLTAMQNLAFALMQSNRSAEALSLFEQVRDRRMEKLGPEHPDTLATLSSIARVYSNTGKLTEAIQLFEQVRDRQIAKLGPNHRATLLTLNDLGSAYNRAGRLLEAIQLLEQVRERNLAKFGPDYPNTWITTFNLANAYLNAARISEAIPLFERVLEAQRQQFPANDPRLANSLAALGRSLLLAQQFADAEPIFKECLSIRETALSDDWLTFNTKSSLGAALAGQKKYEVAEPLLLAGYEGLKAREAKIPANARRARLTEALQRLIDLYTAWDKPGEAEKWSQRMAEQKVRSQP